MIHRWSLVDDKPQKINEIESSFRKVTPELIQKTAKEYLRKTNRTVVVVNVEKGSNNAGGENK
jgi:predicted Zn-dependent peptidase